MKKLLKLILLLMLVAVVAGVVAAVVSRKKFEAMSDEEIRDFLASKLEGKVAADQLTSIQDAVIAGVRSRNGSKGDIQVDMALDDLADEVQASADTVGEKAAEVAEAIAEAADDAD
jgi:hypothetical protein